MVNLFSEKFYLKYIHMEASLSGSTIKYSYSNTVR